MILRYHASLLLLKRSTRDFCEALLEAARCAEELDPRGTSLVDPLADKVYREAVALLREAARLPGARQMLVDALKGALDRKES